METASPRPSANGTAIHIPIELRTSGKISSPQTKKTNVRPKDIIADTMPFEKAVNIADANMLIPIKRKLIA